MEKSHIADVTEARGSPRGTPGRAKGPVKSKVLATMTPIPEAKFPELADGGPGCLNATSRDLCN